MHRPLLRVLIDQGLLVDHEHLHDVLDIEELAQEVLDDQNLAQDVLEDRDRVEDNLLGQDQEELSKGLQRKIEANF